MPQTNTLERPVQTGHEISSHDYPSISVDRAVHHFFDRISLNEEKIARYYDSLPHADKLPLSGLHLHFSASAIVEETKVKGGEETIEYIVEGIHDRDGKTTSDVDTTPELAVKPEVPTITIYLGSILYGAKYAGFSDRQLRAAVNKVLVHELVHYAQLGAELAEEAQAIQEQPEPKEGRVAAYISKVLAGVAMYSTLIDSRLLGGGLFAAGSVESSSTSPTGTLTAGLVTAALTRVTGRKAPAIPRQRTPQEEAEDKRAAHAAYMAEEWELDARSYEGLRTRLVDVVPRPDWNIKDLEAIILPGNSKPTPKHDAANAAHRRLALIPRKPA